MKKPYKAKSLKGAEREVRNLRRQVSDLRELLTQCDAERKVMAMLAAPTPQFNNPLHVAEAELCRDRILKTL